jgi:hypothetical protein
MGEIIWNTGRLTRWKASQRLSTEPGCRHHQPKRSWVARRSQFEVDLLTNFDAGVGIQTRRVVLGNLACERFGLNRNAKYRALRSFESAGLVAIERKLGRSPIVTVLDGSGAA